MARILLFVTTLLFSGNLFAQESWFKIINPESLSQPVSVAQTDDGYFAVGAYVKSCASSNIFIVNKEGKTLSTHESRGVDVISIFDDKIYAVGRNRVYRGTCAMVESFPFTIISLQGEVLFNGDVFLDNEYLYDIFYSLQSLDVNASGEILLGSSVNVVKLNEDLSYKWRNELSYENILGAHFFVDNRLLITTKDSLYVTDHTSENVLKKYGSSDDKEIFKAIIDQGSIYVIEGSYVKLLNEHLEEVESIDFSMEPNDNFTGMSFSDGHLWVSRTVTVDDEHTIYVSKLTSDLTLVEEKEISLADKEDLFTVYDSNPFFIGSRMDQASILSQGLGEESPYDDLYDVALVDVEFLGETRSSEEGFDELTFEVTIENKGEDSLHSVYAHVPQVNVCSNPERSHVLLEELDMEAGETSTVSVTFTVPRRRVTPVNGDERRQEYDFYLIAPNNQIDIHPDDNVFRKKFTTVNVQKALASDAFDVYPNPASNILYVDNGDGNSLVNVEIISLDGRSLHKEASVGKSSLNIESLTPGVYILQVSDERTSGSFRFIKQ
ncbi:T9SS type A sorting domain-containing protein [Cytophagaceae bacterium ABcell3]|nr:T9SS type A sorting domain-containing protein [Cytophagaceae bacterium ABcell3]